MSRRALATAWLVAAGLMVASADAHELGLSRGDYVARGSEVEIVFGMARREAISIQVGLDGDKDGALTETEVAAASSGFAARVLDGVVIEADGQACTAKPGGTRLVAEDGLEVFGAFACPASVEGAALTVRVPLLDTLSTGHRHLAKLSHDGRVDEGMLHKKEPSLAVKAADRRAGGAPAANDGAARGVPTYFRSGALRMLGGEHLAFVVALVLSAGATDRAKRALVLVVGAFVAGLLAALAIGVMGDLRPSPSLLAPLVAVSVVYVGIDNFVVQEPDKRWRIALPFGLLHGLAFAGALADAGLPPTRGGALARYGGGIVVSHVVLLSVLVPLVSFLARKPFYRAWGMRAASGVVVAAGLFLLVRRWI